MKKIISILTTLAFTLIVFTTPVLAFNNNTGSAITIKSTKTLENSLKKAEDQLKKVLDNEVKLEATIQKAIDKAKADGKKQNENRDKQINNTNAQLQKLETDLNKALEKDKKEIAALDAEISKWTEANEKQQATLTKQLTAIDANVIKLISELDKKLANAKDDATKQNIQLAKASVQKYASQRKEAINTYISSLQSIFTQKQKIWAERKALLISRQSADTTFRTAMTNIKKSELNDRLASLLKTPVSTDTTTESKIRDKYKKQVDALKANETKLRETIASLKAQLGK